MKKLVTSGDVKNMMNSGKKTLRIEPGTIITPSAKDLMAEIGITVEISLAETLPIESITEPTTSFTGVGASDQKNSEVSPALIAQIVKEVLASMTGIQQVPEMIKEEDPSGVRLVRGDTVSCEPFNTGNPKDKVGIKEILNIRESPNMCTGFMTVEDSSFSWELKYDEIDYVVDGTLDIEVKGKTYRGKAGDVFYIPRNTTVTFSTPDNAKFFFVTYPANWAELSNYQK